ncbi:MAG: DUF5666 domain-containing protein [Acidobacteriales bacterium]|nr:DUF5666 domain-containing protein [Terriglobales bacterium]
MKPYVLLFTILCFPAFSQTVAGKVQKIDKDQFQVKSSEGLITLNTDEKTTVTNLRKSKGLSPLAVGDEVRVNYYGEGAFTAVNIAVRVTVSGVITEAASNHVTVLPDSTDTTPADRKVGVFVFLNPTTRYGTSRKQLTVGRRVHVVGYAGEGVIDADKVAIYETDMPLRRTP